VRRLALVIVAMLVGCSSSRELDDMSAFACDNLFTVASCEAAGCEAQTCPSCFGMSAFAACFNAGSTHQQVLCTPPSCPSSCALITDEATCVATQDCSSTGLPFMCDQIDMGYGCPPCP